MLKDRTALKEEDWQDAARNALTHLLERVPFARLEEVSQEQSRTGDRHGAGDLLVRVKLGGRSWEIVGEMKSECQPRQIRIALLQLKEYLQAAKGSRYGMVLAPFISERSADACREAGIGFLDLAGNARLSFDRVFIETRGEGNPFRIKRELRSLFSPKALRILRVMLTGKLRPWKVTDLAQSAGVSLGQVSNVRKRLLDEEWASEQVGGIQITSPEEVLKAWRTQKPREKSRVVDLFTLDRQGEFEARLAEAGKRLGIRIALTEMAGAARLAPMARYLRSKAWVDNLEAIVTELQLKQVETGANVVLARPADDGVFYSTREIRGIPVACPVQVYTDLSPGAGRQDEAAEALLDQVIRKEWATATS